MLGRTVTVLKKIMALNIRKLLIFINLNKILSVDLLVEKIVDELQDEDGDAVPGKCRSETPKNPSNNPSEVGVSEEEDNWSEAVLSPVCGQPNRL
jgi:hypothetical protein